MNAKTAEAALLISDGASNPRGVARALVESLDVDNGAGTSPATRLILFQLTYLIAGHEPDDSLDAFIEDRRLCRRLVDANRTA